MRIYKRPKIFIVDDNFVYSYMLNGMLEDLGDFKITILGSGEECLDMLYNKPDLIILDYKFANGINGLETFKRIKLKKPKIPVIILSQQTDVQIAADLLKLGAFDYIEKKKIEKGMLKFRIAVLNALKIN